jgi:multidrug efflux pump subunit AcrA (membrane-fusion protein)
MVSRHTLIPLAALTLALAAPSVWANPPAVPTILVGGGSATTRLDIEGTLQALRQSTVAAQVGGNVLQLAVKAGDRVKAGALLARIDERELQAGLAGGDAGVAQAAAALAQAQQNATRTRDLRTQGFVSQASLDVAETQLQAAQAAHRQAQAGRSQAALARSFAAVTAPFDAVVLATHVETGDLATPGRPLVTLYAPGQLRAVVQMPLSRSAVARASTAVEIVLPGGTPRGTRQPHRTAGHRRRVADRGMAPEPARLKPAPTWPRASRCRCTLQARFARGQRHRRPPGGARRRRAAAGRADGRLRRTGQALRAEGRAPGRAPGRHAGSAGRRQGR